MKLCPDCLEFECCCSLLRVRWERALVISGHEPGDGSLLYGGTKDPDVAYPLPMDDDRYEWAINTKCARCGHEAFHHIEREFTRFDDKSPCECVSLDGGRCTCEYFWFK